MLHLRLLPPAFGLFGRDLVLAAAARALVVHTTLCGRIRSSGVAGRAIYILVTAARAGDASRRMPPAWRVVGQRPIRSSLLRRSAARACRRG